MPVLTLGAGLSRTTRVTRFVAPRQVHDPPHHNQVPKDGIGAARAPLPAAPPPKPVLLKLQGKRKRSPAKAPSSKQAAASKKLRVEAITVKQEPAEGTIVIKTEEEVNPEVEYEIEAILGHRCKGRALQFLIKWAGYDDSYNTWEPWTSFVGGEAGKARTMTDVVREYVAVCPQVVELLRKRKVVID